MVKQGLVSIVVPAYNSASYLQEAIGSILEQTYQNFEILLIDDGSTDKTEDIVSPYKNKIKYIKKENGGPASARNMGIKESSGEYISFLDSDDLYLPFRLEEGISLFTKSPEIDIIFSRFGLIGHLIDDRFDYAAKINNGHIFDNLLQGNFICTSTVMLRRRCLNNDAPFDEDKNLISVEDYNLWLKVAFKHNFGFIDKITVKRRQHQNALSADFERMFNADFYNFEKIKSYFLKEHNMDLEKHGNYLMGKFNYRIKFAREYFYFRNYSSARSQFIEALKIRKSNVAAYFFYLLCSLPKSFIEFLRKIV